MRFAGVFLQRTVFWFIALALVSLFLLARSSAGGFDRFSGTDPNPRIGTVPAKPDTGSLELLAHWSIGPCLAVDAAGDTVYCGMSEYFEVVDASDPMNPNEMGTVKLPQYIEGIEVSGGYAYVADGAYGIRIIDVSDPSNPFEAGVHDSFFYASGVAVSGSKVYAAGLTTGLYIVDVSDPSNPSAMGHLDTGGVARDVAVSGNYAYVADGDSGLVVIDISDPMNPFEAGKFNTPFGHAWAVYVRGSIAYMADGGNGFYTIDISVPTSPTEIGNFDFLGAYAWNVDVDLNYAYVSFGDDGLFKITISDPSFLVSAGSANTFDAQDAAVSGSYVYAADGNHGMQVIDRFGGMSLKGNFDMGDEVNKIALKGSYAYIADGENGLGVINVSDSTNPVHTGYCNTPGNALDVAVSGNYAYVADWTDGLRVIDVSDPANPFEAGSYTATSGIARAVTVSGNYAYLGANQGGGLYIIDISTPGSPSLAGYYDYACTDVAVSGNYAYITALTSGLRIIDISNPASPFEAGFFVTSYAQAVCLVGNRAYIADDSAGGLRIIDISNPASPFEIGSFDTPWLAYDVTVVGNYAYVADWSDGLIVLDITNPAILVQVGNFSDNTWDQAYGVAYSWGTVYLADVANGLYVLRNALLVSVLITDLAADVTDGGVRIEWKIEADEKISGFRLYREEALSQAVAVIPNYGLLPPETRSFTDDGVLAGGKYIYTLAAVKPDGSEQLSQKISVETKAPSLALNQNYPNPFTFSTSITFTLNEKAHAALSVYDLQGRLITKLLDRNLDRGFNEKFWDGRDSKGVPVGSGVYFYRLSAGKQALTRKMVLMR